MPHADVGGDAYDRLPDFAKDFLDKVPDVDIPWIDIPAPKLGDAVPFIGWANYIARLASANSFSFNGLVLLPDRVWEGPVFIEFGSSESVALGTIAELAVGTGRLTFLGMLPPLKVESEKSANLPVPPAPATVTPFLNGSSSVFIHDLPALRWLPTDVSGCGVTPGFPPLLPGRSVFIGG